MLYLITGEWTENPNESAQETAALWEQITRPSLESMEVIAASLLQQRFNYSLIT